MHQNREPELFVKQLQPDPVSHHITPKVYVPSKPQMNKLTEEANNILARYEIDPNDAGNGTFLPNKYAKGFDHENYGPLHSPLNKGDDNLHTKEYMDRLLDHLRAADVPGASPDDIRDALQEFANELINFKI